MEHRPPARGAMPSWHAPGYGCRSLPSHGILSMPGSRSVRLTGEQAFEPRRSFHEEPHRLRAREAPAQFGNPAPGVACNEVALRAAPWAWIAALRQRLGFAECEEVQELELGREVIRQFARRLGKGQPEVIVEACKGDSGSPLILTNGRVPRIVGVVSWGLSTDKNCGPSGQPGVYTEIESFAPWICKIMGQDSDARACARLTTPTAARQ